MLAQLCAISLKKRAPCEQRQVHRGPIMAKARQGILPRLNRTARHSSRFKHANAPAFGCQMQGGGQAVMPCADQHCVELGQAIVLRHFSVDICKRI